MRDFKINFNFKRATILVALFFSVQVSTAATVSKKLKENYKDIIEKAYNLSLQKDRAQAISLLIGAIKREGKKSSSQKELVQALDQISKLFISDKAQQQYELGLSLKFSDPVMSLTKLTEASRIEPDNGSIDIAIAQLQMASGDCDGASNKINKNKDLVIYIEDWRLLSAQSSLCENKFENYLVNKQGADLKGAFTIYWMILEVEYLFRTNQAQKGKDLLASMTKIDPLFPENYYWSWKINQALRQKSDKDAQKYMNSCKTLNSRRQRSYSSEPFLCRRTVEVETFLKNNNNAEL